MDTQTIISRVWQLCHTLRDDGIDYPDYLEQLTYLIFLKMASEYQAPPHHRDFGIPQELGWDSLSQLSGVRLSKHYENILSKLGLKDKLLSEIFSGAINKIRDPGKLKIIIRLIGTTQWVTADSDTKGAIYEGILEKNAEDTKSGAGQYFTPRALISAIVECVAPEPGKTIADPACGTGGFFLSAYEYIAENYQLTKKQKSFLRTKTFYGNEIVAGTRRLCLMNLFLHNIGEIDGQTLISRADALIGKPTHTVDYVLANPPFGKKSSMTFTNEEGEQERGESGYSRPDFWTTTSNKQLNFLQHIRAMLKTTAKAAVVLPDNVLFERGAGEVIRRKLMETADLHTILRLPTGIFYAQGVKANVLFFDTAPLKKKASTKNVWYYDYRTNIRHTLKRDPLRLDDLKDFVRCYRPEDRSRRRETWHPLKNPEGRWRKFSYEELSTRDAASLDLFWLRDESVTDHSNLPEPESLAAEIIVNIEAGLLRFQKIASLLRSSTSNQK